MNLKIWGYLILPGMAILLALSAIAIDLFSNNRIHKTAIILILAMIPPIFIGIKNKVWEDK